MGMALAENCGGELRRRTAAENCGGELRRRTAEEKIDERLGQESPPSLAQGYFDALVM